MLQRAIAPEAVGLAGWSDDHYESDTHKCAKTRMLSYAHMQL